MKAAPSIGIVGLLVSLTGCATLLGGTTQTLTVNSNVNGAQVHLNETLLGVTPLNATVTRGQEGVLRVTSPGYTPYQIALNKKISTLFWVNLLSGGSLGSTTDYATGAMYEYEPSTYMVSLQRGTASNLELEQWRLREGIRAFVLQNNEPLVADLAKGQGEYLEVLFGALDLKPQDRDGAVATMRGYYKTSRTAAEFAERVVAEIRQ